MSVERWDDDQARAEAQAYERANAIRLAQPGGQNLICGDAPDYRSGRDVEADFAFAGGCA